MLEELSISQFVTIESLHLHFERGLHVLTGESGTGKSLIFDALSLLLGQRGSPDYVRKGSKKAVLEAQLSFDMHHPVVSHLQDIGVELAFEGQTKTIIVQREMTRQGRSTCRVNGHLVPLNTLRKIGQFLFNQYRQHESQQLFDTRTHKNWLDASLDKEGQHLLTEYGELWVQYRSLTQTYVELQQQTKKRLHQQDLYQFQLREIKTTSLLPNEEEQLEIESSQLTHAEKIRLGLEKIYHLLSEEAMDTVGEAVQQVEQLVTYDQELASVATLLHTCFYQIEEAVQMIRQKRDTLYDDPQRLSEIQERLSQIHQLKRKYGDSIQAILEYAATIEGELEQIEHLDDRITQLQKQMEALKPKIRELAEKLSEKRNQAAQILTRQVQAELQQLQMQNVLFQVHIEHRQEIDAEGIDQVLFLLSTQPGIAPEPLLKVASGGELSRLMLALKTVFSDVEKTETVLFDEIDSGVSGQSAQAISNKLFRLSRKVQVICISHLPQVVSMADIHYLVEKADLEGQSSLSTVRMLEEEQRIQALAEMLEGAHVNRLSIQHAADMLLRAQKQKKELETDG